MESPQVRDETRTCNGKPDPKGHAQFYGNILRYHRNGNTAGGLDMDKMQYLYTAGTNKLDHIYDTVSAGNYSTDIDGQSAGNYKYDSIGQLIHDGASEIDSIYWTVYGKIARIIKNGGDTILLFTYDPGGNRISKSVVHSGDTLTTWYVRDAQGNVLSVYTYGDPAVHGKDLTQTELHIYGSSRLGILKPNVDVYLAAPASTFPVPLLGTGDSITFARGNKFFELTNHLGNVLVTISDKRFGVTPDSVVRYFIPDVVSANDYYPFGSPEPGRSYAQSGTGYRYGFNGKEKDDEVKGAGDQIDYGMRVYDPRVGRFLSVDPLARKYPWLSTYQFASNSPIANIDWDGGESKYYSVNIFVYLSKGNVILANITSTKVEETGEETRVRGMFHMGHGPKGTGTRTDFYFTEEKIVNGKPVVTTRNLGYSYEPAEGDADTKKKGRGGLYFTSKNGEFTHATGDVDEGDGKPISLDLLVAALGSGSNNGESEEEALEKLITQPKVGDKVVEMLEKIKDLEEAGARAMDIKEALETMAEDNKKEKQEQVNIPQDHSVTPSTEQGTIIFKRDDDFGTGTNRERKGSVQHHAYSGDKVDSIKKDTFYIKSSKN